MRQKPEVVKALRELAIIQSVESSNRIEGVTVAADRLRPLVIGHARPRDRSEEELAGYRRGLDWIFTRKRPVAVTPAVIQHLHKLAQQGAGDAGKLKARDNEIIEILPSGGRRVRFKPTPAARTAAELNELCTAYEHICEQESLPPLLTIATFVFDLLCIHPFRDGNGRVSRLATILLLQQNRFEVGRFISIERLIEERKEDYYAVLERCSKGWHKGENEIVPWWNFLLGVMRSAYRAFEEQVASAPVRQAKSELIRRIALGRPDSFTLADIAAELPSASPQLIKKVLGSMKRAGQVKLVGRGRGAEWRVVR
ncbi:Adenosine monophosphate-protein transferase SoFic [Phycisphaerae bacterium RAS1]|nr:Adenosine monophosphate-protein transferase SoFic [Phycisphaerae bacterium RAS1]